MIEIFCDFDGTLTDKDTLVVLLDRYASANWYAIEEKALSGDVDERESLREELALITAPDDDLMETLEQEIHPADGLDQLIALIREKEWPMQVLSGGLIRFSGELWRNWGYGEFPFFANDHRRDSQERIQVIPSPTPRLRERCNHCKRWHLEAARRRGSQVVYIGDGLTDFCPAEAADRRYAKGNLLKYLQEQELEAIPYENLQQVATHLRRNPP
ncbi:MAG: HAD-IB family phosphatase [bacterium]|nr:HAD-IB family phosphatase [bacterium]